MTPVKFIKTAGIVCILIVGFAVGTYLAFTQFKPLEIEPDRIRPQAKMDLPKIQSDPDHIDFFFEPSASEIKPGDSYPLVHLRIPKKPHFEADTPSGSVRTYGQTLDTVWPALAGLGESGGAACLEHYRSGKGGFCPNLVRIYMDFMWPQSPSLEQKYLIKADSETQKYAFEAEGNRRIPGLDLMGTEIGLSKELESLRNTRYVSRDHAGIRDLVIDCSAHAPSPSCETSFTATRSPNVNIKILFDYSLLPQWREIVGAVRSKVDNLIVENYSSKTNTQ